MRIREEITSRIDVIPAQPGWFVLTGYGHHPLDALGEIGFNRDAIVAWRIHSIQYSDGDWTTASCTPICTDSLCESGCGLGEGDIILQPNGMVYFWGDRSFDNEADALSEYVKRVKKERNINA